MSSGVQLRAFPFHGGGVTAVVSTRHGGVSTGPYDSLNLGGHVGDVPAAVAENRNRLAAALGVGRLTFADQRHTDRVAVVTRDLAGRGHQGAADAVAAFPATDAMITDLPGVALAILVADCAPVVLYDPVRRAVGVAHSGRAGTLHGVVPKTVAAMTAAFGSAPDDLLIGIGPAIGAASYEIGAADASDVMAVFGTEGTRLLLPNRAGHALFDLPGAIRHQLRAAGVPSASVHDLAIDTRQSTDTFFSDRAARPCGRFAAVACLAGLIPHSLETPRCANQSASCAAGRSRHCRSLSGVRRRSRPRACERGAGTATPRGQGRLQLPVILVEPMGKMVKASRPGRDCGGRDIITVRAG